MILRIFNSTQRHRAFLCLALVALVIFLFPKSGMAHPHVFVENKLIIVFDDQGMAGIRVEWVFDEMFSSLIMEDFLGGLPKTLKKQDMTLIKEKVFDNLKEYGYFTFVKINGKPFEVKFIQNFEADVLQERLVYRFFIPCHVKTLAQWKSVTVSQYDPTYYTAVYFAEKTPVQIKARPGIETKFSIEKNMDESYYYKMMNPVEVILRFRIKKKE